jgi:hypothetical protein
MLYFLFISIVESAEPWGIPRLPRSQQSYRGILESMPTTIASLLIGIFDMNENTFHQHIEMSHLLLGGGQLERDCAYQF